MFHTQWPHAELCLLPFWRPSPGTVVLIRAHLDYKLPQPERKAGSASENSVEDCRMENGHFLTGKVLMISGEVGHDMHRPQNVLENAGFC